MLNVTLVGKGAPRSCLNCKVGNFDECTARKELSHGPYWKTDMPKKKLALFRALADYCNRYEEAGQ